MAYSVRHKTVWLATHRAFYRKSRRIDITTPVYDFRTWRVPMNLAWKLMQAGYVMNEETAAAWAFDNKPEGCILRGITREPMHSFRDDATMEEVITHTRAIEIRKELQSISFEAMLEPLCKQKKGTGCREFANYSEWYAAVLAASVH